MTTSTSTSTTARISGIVAPLLRDNVDTDAILRSSDIDGVGKLGFGARLFAGWREADPGFVLNREPYRRATILLARKNFGCGSSREAAVWALRGFGIRSVIAGGFGGIFHASCIANGLVPVVLAEAQIEALAAQIEASDGAAHAVVDLAAQVVVAPDGQTFRFALAAIHREILLGAPNAIGVTLKRDAELAAFERRDRVKRPWSYLTSSSNPDGGDGRAGPV